MDLLELLGKELHEQVKAKLGDKNLIIDDGKLIPKARFDEVNQKKTALETELATTKESLNKVTTEFESTKTKQTESAKTLEEKLAAIEAKQLETEKKLIAKEQETMLNSKRSAIKEALRGANVNQKYLNTLTREIEIKHPLDKLEIENGKVKDADTILNPFKEEFKEMFGEFKIEGTTPNQSGSNNSGTDFSKMTDTEWFAYNESQKK